MSARLPEQSSLMEQCPFRGPPAGLPGGGSSEGSRPKGYLGLHQGLVFDDHVMGLDLWEDGYLREYRGLTRDV